MYCETIENEVPIKEGKCQTMFGFGKVRYPCPHVGSRECPLTVLNPWPEIKAATLPDLIKYIESRNLIQLAKSERT